MICMKIVIWCSRANRFLYILQIYFFFCKYISITVTYIYMWNESLICHTRMSCHTHVLYDMSHAWHTHVTRITCHTHVLHHMSHAWHTHDTRMSHAWHVTRMSCHTHVLHHTHVTRMSCVWHACVMRVTGVWYAGHACDMRVIWDVYTYYLVQPCKCISITVTDMYVTWLVDMCDMTHWHVWHDSLACVTWCILILSGAAVQTHTHHSDLYIYVKWLIVTYMYVHDSLTCVTWLIDMCDMICI